MFYGPECDLFWWVFHVSFRRTYILLLLDKAIYRCPLHPADWRYCWVQLCTYWFSVLYLYISDRGILRSPITIMETSIFHCSSISFFLTHIVWHSAVRHIHIKNYYVFFENWPLYHYVMPQFSPDNPPCFESCFD